jgi:hypothetical protein
MEQVVCNRGLMMDGRDGWMQSAGRWRNRARLRSTGRSQTERKSDASEASHLSEQYEGHGGLRPMGRGRGVMGLMELGRGGQKPAGGFVGERRAG